MLSMTIKTLCGAAGLALLSTQALAVAGGGFALTIRDRAEDYRGYVRLDHGAVYAVCFRNDLGRMADAELTIDGLPMGTWRLVPGRVACVERPVSDTGRFTFYRADSAEGYAVGSGQVARSDKGRVSVRFVPERERYIPQPEPYATSRSYSAAPEQEMAEDSMTAAAPYNAPSARHKMSPPNQRLGAGVTGLSGESEQHFRTTGPIDRDYASAVMLELRLVHDPALERPVDPRPLPGRYDRLAPPPVGY